MFDLNVILNRFNSSEETLNPCSDNPPTNLKCVCFSASAIILGKNLLVTLFMRTDSIGFEEDIENNLNRGFEVDVETQVWMNNRPWLTSLCSVLTS